MNQLTDQQVDDFDTTLNNKYFDNMQDAWNSKKIKETLTDATTQWILDLAPWKNFITLTFKNETPPDKAKRLLFILIKSLNTDLLGKHYTKKVGHSYFSYAIGIEYQKRDVIHFHVITDLPVNFQLIHTFWNRYAGFAWTEIIKDKNDTVSYIAKYTLKGGEVEVYKAKKKFFLDHYPTWWEEEIQQLALPKI